MAVPLNSRGLAFISSYISPETSAEHSASHMSSLSSPSESSSISCALTTFSLMQPFDYTTEQKAIKLSYIKIITEELNKINDINYKYNHFDEKRINEPFYIYSYYQYLCSLKMELLSIIRNKTNILGQIFCLKPFNESLLRTDNPVDFTYIVNYINYLTDLLTQTYRDIINFLSTFENIHVLFPFDTTTRGHQDLQYLCNYYDYLNHFKAESIEFIKYTANLYKNNLRVSLDESLLNVDVAYLARFLEFFKRKSIDFIINSRNDLIRQHYTLDPFDKARCSHDLEYLKSYLQYILHKKYP